MLRRRFLALAASSLAIADDLLSGRWHVVTEDALNSAIRNGWGDGRRGLRMYEEVEFLTDFRDRSAYRLSDVPTYGRAARFRSRHEAIKHAYNLGVSSAQHCSRLCEEQRDKTKRPVRATFRGNEYPTVELHGREIRAYHEFAVS